MSWLSTLTDWIMGALAAIGIGTGEPNTIWHGYVEGEYVRVAAPLAGRLERLAVARGDQVEHGTLLFAMDLTEALAERDRAIAARAQTRANLDDLRKGKRIPEARRDRRPEGPGRGGVAALGVGAAPAGSLACIRQRVARARRRGAQRGTRATARASPSSPRSSRSAAWRRARTTSAPPKPPSPSPRRRWSRPGRASRTWRRSPGQAAVVEETYYRQGEWVQAGAPVVSLLPPGNVKVRFFVPEARAGRARGRPGRGAALRRLSAGRCARRISFISPQAEYTPPVIYSDASRAKLVFMIEARPAPTGARAASRPAGRRDAPAIMTRRHWPSTCAA